MKAFRFTLLCSLFYLLTTAFTGDFKVCGVVTDNDGQPLIGANVLEKGTTNGTVTDIDGTFCITTKSAYPTLEIAYTGFESKEFVATVGVENKITLSDGVSLDEVVVTGFGSRREKRIFGSAKTKSASRSAARKYSSESVIAMDVAMEAPVAPSHSIDAVESKRVLPKSGLLTAAEWNDLHNWNDWKNLIKKKEYKNMESHWDFNTQHRVSVLVLNELDFPVVDANVTLKDKSGSVVWTSKTDNAGVAELWAESKSDDYHIEVKGRTSMVDQEVSTRSRDRNIIVADESCSKKQIVDVAFVVDATGSMGDEISYLQSELTSVLERVSKENKKTNFRTGAVFYRDNGDAYLTKKSEFTEDFSETNTWIANQGYGGGGDYPEAVDDGLEDALGMNWSKEATARLLFLVLDAPPHHNSESLKRINKLTRQASEQGIKLIPITASGIDRETEFLMKMMAIKTNGTYVFITDDSGIGGAHLDPVVEDFEVELLNDLLVRLISNYAKQDHCEDQQYADTQFKVFPNPARAFTKVQVPEDETDLVLLAANGKIVLKKPMLDKGEHQLDLKHLTAGFYTVQLLRTDTKVAAKLFITGNS